MDGDASDIVEYVGPHGFDVTLERVTEAIDRAGLTLFATIDHAAGARAAGLVMPPTTVLMYGHAKGGTPLMLASPSLALDLPLRVLVRQRDDGKTAVAFHPARTLLRRAGIPEDMASRLDPAQSVLLEALKP